jgi:hypothetical protein
MPCVLTRGAGVGSASVLSVGEAAGSRAPAVRGSARQVGLGSQPLRSHAVAAQAGGGLGAAAVATGMQTPGMQVVDPMNGGGDHAQDKEKLYQLVAELSREETRETALLELSKKRETFPDLAPILWHSFGTTATLLQEIVCIYPLLSPPQLTGGLLSHTRFSPRPPMPSGPFLISSCVFACCLCGHTRVRVRTRCQRTRVSTRCQRRAYPLPSPSLLSPPSSLLPPSSSLLPESSLTPPTPPSLLPHSSSSLAHTRQRTHPTGCATRWRSCSAWHRIKTHDSCFSRRTFPSSCTPSSTPFPR